MIVGILIATDFAHAACQVGQITKTIRPLEVYYKSEAKSETVKHTLFNGTEVHIISISPTTVEIYAGFDLQNTYINSLAEISTSAPAALACQ